MTASSTSYCASQFGHTKRMLPPSSAVDRRLFCLSSFRMLSYLISKFKVFEPMRN